MRIKEEGTAKRTLYNKRDPYGIMAEVAAKSSGATTQLHGMPPWLTNHMGDAYCQGRDRSGLIPGSRLTFSSLQ